MIQVNDYALGGWASASNPDDRTRWYCARLEEGKILYFAGTPYELPSKDRDFLIGVRQTSAAYHKNISYRPREDRVHGLDRRSADTERLRAIMAAYSRHVTSFTADFLRPYAHGWKLDFASFRSLEERGRDLPLKQRNDLLHTDAFPTRPTNGNRILRVFTNLNPSEPRVWLTGEPFDLIASRLAPEAGLADCAAMARSSLRPLGRLPARFATALGLPVPDRSPYDCFMLGFHDYLKANRAFQESTAKSRWEFPPNSTWIVFTDSVPHAVLSGRLALEHTYIISEGDLMLPEKSPRQVLEKLAGTSLKN